MQNCPLRYAARGTSTLAKLWQPPELRQIESPGSCFAPLADLLREALDLLSDREGLTDRPCPLREAHQLSGHQVGQVILLSSLSVRHSIRALFGQWTLSASGCLNG